jgi:hypothetical protein
VALVADGLDHAQVLKLQVPVQRLP